MNMKTLTFFVQYFGGKADKLASPTELDRIAEPAKELLYGKDSFVILSFDSGKRQDDSYAIPIELSVGYPDRPWGVESDEKRPEPKAEDILAILKGVLRLGKFSFGRKVAESFESNELGQVKVMNSAGQVQFFDHVVVKLYNRYRLHLSEFTAPMDQDGINSIRICTGDDDKTAVVFDKKDRTYLRCEKGSILTENECELFLEIAAPKLNTSAEGWRFSEGKGGLEFTATIEDTDFLKKVHSGEIQFGFGAGMYAVVRTVQRKAERTQMEKAQLGRPFDDLGEPAATERTIVKVLEFYEFGQPF